MGIRKKYGKDMNSLGPFKNILAHNSLSFPFSQAYRNGKKSRAEDLRKEKQKWDRNSYKSLGNG
jgi:hypothetical protein